MSADPIPASLDNELLCYCVGLTFGDLRVALRADPGAAADLGRAGKLCTGCMGDLLHCVRHLTGEPGAEKPR